MADEPQPIHLAKPPKAWDEMTDAEKDAWSDGVVDRMYADRARRPVDPVVIGRVTKPVSEMTDAELEEFAGRMVDASGLVPDPDADE